MGGGSKVLQAGTSANQTGGCRSGSTWATTTALWYRRTSGVGGVRGSTPFCCRLTLVGEALLEVVSSSCRAANLLHAHRVYLGPQLWNSVPIQESNPMGP